MFFRKVDFISPPITIFYKGESSHTSIFSGILSLIVYGFSFILGMIFFVNFLRHADPQVYYYNRYVENAGVFPINASSLFNFIQIIDTKTNKPNEVDFDSIRIIGIEETIEVYEKNNNLSEYNHWIYGKCNNSTDTEGINDLITFEHFTESACIRKYYNKKEHKYYDTTDINFKWPALLYGCSNPNRTFYGIILEKCRNDSIKQLLDGNLCKSEDKIVDYINNNSINLQLIDNYADVVNYKNPFIKYFYSISNGLFENVYTTNHLNLNPATLITDDDLFLAKTKEIESYFYEQNEKISKSSQSGIYVAFYFWMQNRMQYYERKYSKFQDVLSDIGGLAGLLLTFAECINYLVSNFIIIFDTDKLLHEIENSRKYGKNIIRSDIYKNLNEKKSISVINDYFPPLRKGAIRINNNNNNNSNNTTSFNKFFKSKTNKSNEIQKQINTIHNIKIEDVDNINIYSIDNTKSVNHKLNAMNLSGEYKIRFYEQNRSNDILSNDKSSEANNTSRIIIQKKKIEFWHYIIHLFYEKYKPRISEVEDFRCRILSEENLILNYLSVIKLLRAVKKLMYKQANEALINLDQLLESKREL